MIDTTLVVTSALINTTLINIEHQGHAQYDSDHDQWLAHFDTDQDQCDAHYDTDHDLCHDRYDIADLSSRRSSAGTTPYFVWIVAVF